ncbi:hypothetical protein BDK92_1720 [Micromonospora pisi]|uniref:Streptogrisin C n=2 Tax=Micromonospora pisi TaxID=589240 RepID=A0A495JGD6_9ACTN|nr:hypothetical protein BDK92_1720 [Micromonospora pisi]
MAGAVAGALVLVAGAGVPAAAAPDGAAGTGSASAKTTLTGTPSGEAAKMAPLFAVQEKLNRAADSIRAAGGDQAGSGFAGDRVDAAANTLTVYWRGALPAPVAATVEAMRSEGIAVEVRAAKHSLDELLKEADRVIGRTVSGVRVISTSPANDGSGLKVGVKAVSTGIASTGIASTDLQRADSELTATVPLDLAVETPREFTSRGSDTVPYWGGALILSGGACTSGFGVRGLNGAARYLLTAAHCGGGQWTTGTGAVIGNTLANATREYDGELILTNAGYSVYEGPSFASGDTNVGRTITGPSSNHVGNAVCTGGSFSGTACGWTVVALNQSFDIEGFGTIRGLVQAEAANRVAGIGNGDSGGPVYVQSGTTGTARGIISLRSDESSEIVACNGVPSGPISDPNSRQCSWKWWYVDVNQQLSRLGVHFAP